MLLSTSLFIIVLALAVLILIESQIAVGKQMGEVKVEVKSKR